MGFGFCFNLLSILLCLSVLAAPISAEFFSDVSSIPPWMNSTSSSWKEFKKLAGCHAGEKLDGLSKLKQYFQHFGYLPELGFNFTDEFDKKFESAVRTYQKNFNLNVTGELDELTLKQVQRPRCGVADIINGSTSMNSGKPSHFKGSNFHTVSHYSFFPGTPRWPASKQDLTYAFLPDNQLPDDVKSVFARAFSRWSAVTPLTFTATETFSSADIRIGFFTGDHGDGEPFDGVLGTLAHAFSPPSGRFHLDGDENWVISGDIRTASLSSSAIDLESVAVHEIGHLLGLGHSSVEEAIMYPTISSRTRKIELNTDDINGIQELYGSNPNGTNSSTPGTSTQERDTSGGAHNLTPWWGLCLVLAVDFVLLSHMISFRGD